MEIRPPGEHASLARQRGERAPRLLLWLWRQTCTGGKNRKARGIYTLCFTSFVLFRGTDPSPDCYRHFATVNLLLLSSNVKGKRRTNVSWHYSSSCLKSESSDQLSCLQVWRTPTHGALGVRVTTWRKTNVEVRTQNLFPVSRANHCIALLPFPFHWDNKDSLTVDKASIFASNKAEFNMTPEEDKTAKTGG